MGERDGLEKVVKSLGTPMKRFREGGVTGGKWERRTLGWATKIDVESVGWRLGKTVTYVSSYWDFAFQELRGKKTLELLRVSAPLRHENPLLVI